MGSREEWNKAYLLEYSGEYELKERQAIMEIEELSGNKEKYGDEKESPNDCNSWIRLGRKEKRTWKTFQS